ncbi:MAG: radical SAM protein [Clostridia bacterium]|nr:radical SAM protein [Clostridia bacterium]
MANIALLNRCNLKCPYCFAENYTGMEKGDISIDALNTLLDFCASEGRVGLIGGEPFLHKEIDKILEILREDFRFSLVTVFTNGIFMGKHLGNLAHPKFKLLINVNSRADIGESAFLKMREGIKNALSLMPRDRVDLGINVYRENQDFEDFLSIVKEFGFRRIRVSVVIPKDKSEGSIAYFKRMKPTLLELYRRLGELGACPCYDCNAIPECVYTDEEKSFLESLPFENAFERDIFLGRRSVCSAVIDLYPDLTATRCFGMDSLRVPISDFKSIRDLSNFFFKEIDCRLVNTPSCEECESCYKFKTFSCFGGCLCYK